MKCPKCSSGNLMFCSDCRVMFCTRCNTDKYAIESHPRDCPECGGSAHPMSEKKYQFATDSGFYRFSNVKR